ncbi:HPP family protein [Rhodobacter sp. KR11]|uniref:HPP family protein n=1 Tax=Rhodobacter sp. KR11 TaxID=2974588 RepID=UPI002222087F|nr:HPP family protein [Rhodobacter sp. KR11]MCW1917258.1 HPP family protein [Rhodobacter sp. KR11]
MRFHGFGPPVPFVRPWDAARMALGLALGLTLAQVGMGLVAGDIWGHPWLIAPFGASAVLIFGVPSSPLAQPWTVVIGNAVSGLVALGVLQLGLPVVAAAILAASLAVAAMGLLRATHPPGGAVALALVLAQTLGQTPDLGFWASRVVLGSCLLVAVGVFWNPMTGRAYPFRHAKG